MKKVIIISIVILVILGGLLVALAFYNANYLINRYKSQLESVVNNAIGGNITFGEISFHVIPTPRFKVGGLKIENSKDVSIDELVLYPKFWTLIKKQLDVRKLSISGKLLDGIPIVVNGSGLSYQIDKSTLSLDNTNVAFLNSSIEARADVDTSSRSGKVEFKDGKISLASLAPLFEKVAPAVKQYNLSGDVGLQGDLQFSKGTYAINSILLPRGLQAKIKDYSISDGTGKIVLSSNQSRQQLQVSDLGFKVNSTPGKLSCDAVLEGKSLHISKANLDMFSGRVGATADYSLGEDGVFKADVVGQGLDLENLLGFITPQKPSFSGTLKSLRASLSGQNGPDIKNSLKATASLELSPAVLKGVNIFAKVLQSIQGIPLIEGDLGRYIPEELRGQLNSPDTPFTYVKGNYSIANSWIQVSGMWAEGQFMTILADGRVSFDGDIDLKTMVTLHKEFCRSLSERIKNFDKLLSEDGTLSIPVNIKGKGKQLVVIPDLKNLMKIGVGKAIKEQATKALDKVLGGKGKMFGF